MPRFLPPVAGRRPATAILAVASLALLAIAAKPGAPNRRAAPPKTDWDGLTAGSFYDDAFSELSGPRPNFATDVRQMAGPSPSPPPDGTDGGSGGGGGTGFKWSGLVSGDALIDEIKDQKDLVSPTVASPSVFKGGGYKQARDSFSMLAVAFGLIAAHDEDIRWRKDAAAARDLFARAGFNCKTATDQGFNESKLRVEDLDAMFSGNAPKGKPDRDEDFKWDQTAARPALMARLELAEKAVAAGLSSAGEFSKSLDKVRHEAEIVAALGEVIGQPNFEYHDDDSYLEFSRGMRDAGIKIKEACAKKDYEAARAAAGGISKACSGCHESYR
jgi:hypothetical protein